MPSSGNALLSSMWTRPGGTHHRPLRVRPRKWTFSEHPPGHRFCCRSCPPAARNRRRADQRAQPPAATLGGRTRPAFPAHHDLLLEAGQAEGEHREQLLDEVMLLNRGVAEAVAACYRHRDLFTSRHRVRRCSVRSMMLPDAPPPSPEAPRSRRSDRQAIRYRLAWDRQPGRDRDIRPTSRYRSTESRAFHHVRVRTSGSAKREGVGPCECCLFPPTRSLDRARGPPATRSATGSPPRGPSSMNFVDWDARSAYSPRTPTHLTAERRSPPASPPRSRLQCTRFDPT